jgi:pilus assembly protein Flp/PilA
LGEGEEIHVQDVQLARRLKRDENGATLLEYTVLLGLLVVAVLATIGLVGAWILGQWSALNTAL